MQLSAFYVSVVKFYSFVSFFPVFDSLPQATLALIGLKLLGYIIAVVGFALCVPGKQFVFCESVLFTHLYLMFVYF